MQTANAVNINGYSQKNTQQRSTQDDTVKISVSNFIIALRMFYWIVILIVIIGTVIGFAASKLLYEPVYSTSATFTISAIGTDGADYGFKTTLDDKLIAAEKYVITSSTLKDMVIDKLGEDYSMCQITAEEIVDTNIVTVNVTADSKEKAYTAVEEVISQFPEISKKIFGNVSVSLLDEVVLEDTPVNSSDKNKMIVLGAAVGLLIGLGTILLYSITLNLVSDAQTLQRYVNAECIGKAPMLSAKVVHSAENVTIENRNVPDDFKEAFQFIRTRAERCCRRNNYKTILVTSTYPGEGKSTVSINIALSLAQNNKSVVIIDCDLRNPSICERLGANSGKFGFDDYLFDKCSFEDALVRLPKSNVFFISAKKHLDNAADLLGSKKMERAVERAKAMADYVIIDSPPTDVMGDSITLSRYADTSIFVVKQNYGKINNVIYAIESMKQSKAEPMGFILNGAYDRIGLFEYASGGSYGYGYGYGHGYGYGRNRYGYNYAYGRHRSKSSAQTEKSKTDTQVKDEQADS